MTSTPAMQEPLVDMEATEAELSYLSIATVEHGLLIETRKALDGIAKIVGRYEAKLRELEQQLAAATSKFETAKECADIMGRQLEEARGTLRANGIYDDEGEDANDD